MNPRMKYVLSSLQRARLHLDNPASSPDVHSVVHDLMQELIYTMGLTNSWETAGTPVDETWEHVWLYDLIEGLTDTCFKLSEATPDQAALTLRTRLDRAIEGCLRPPPPLHA